MWWRTREWKSGELSFCKVSENPARAVGCRLPISTRDALSWLRLIVLPFPGHVEETWGQPQSMDMCRCVGSSFAQGRAIV